MTFLAPQWLWALVGVAVLAVVYVVQQRRRGQYAVRFTNLALLDAVAPKRPSWRRHLPAAAYLLAVAGLVLAVARPTHEANVAKADVIMAIDVSLSMEATDVRPSRIAAAQRSAIEFLDAAPPELEIGVVVFNERASLLVSPTRDRDQVRAALERLQLELQGGTAIGEAIAASVETLKTSSGVVTNDDGDDDTPIERLITPGRIVLLSDGTNTSGRLPLTAAAQATDLDIEVTTIAFGTPDGVVVTQGQRQPVPADAETLRSVARATGGGFYTAESGDELTEVYREISDSIGSVPEQREIAEWFVGAALVALLAAGIMSLAWFARLP